jgi:hypothetical protein
MKRPTKKAFYEYMSTKYDMNFKEPSAYDTLLDIIVEAGTDDTKMMALAELTLMNKTDRLIYRNKLACEGIEMTPMQIDEYLAVVEYALEYTV